MVHITIHMIHVRSYATHYYTHNYTHYTCTYMYIHVVTYMLYDDIGNTSMKTSTTAYR